MKWFKEKAIKILIEAIISLLECLLSKEDKEQFRRDFNMINNQKFDIDE